MRFKEQNSIVASVFLLSCFVPIILSSCVSNIPVSDYAVARSAWENAKEAGAARLAPSFWNRADHAYKKGQKLFSERDYSGARDAFEEARFYAEKAENTARVASPDGAPVQ